MLHIVFFILKLILLLILAVLAVILAVFLSVLLAPVRYQGEMSLHERFSAEGKVSWLFHLLACSFSWGEEGIKTDLRILWFHPFQEKQGAETEAGESALEEPAEEDLVTIMEKGLEEMPEDPDVFPGPTEFSSSWKENGKEEAKEQERVEKQEAKTARPEAFGEEKKRREGLFGRMKGKAEQLKKRVSRTARRVRKNILSLKQKKDSLSDLLSDEKNKKTFRLLVKETKRLCKKLFPQIKGSVSFGVDDPYLMGQILTVLAFFYPYYGHSLELEAVFNENVLEGDVSVKGKISFGTFALSGLRILGDRDFRALIKRFLREGGV